MCAATPALPAPAPPASEARRGVLARARTDLAEYLQLWGPGCGRFNNVRPAHFQLFCLRKVRAKGHGSLSYLAQRKIESVFEEKVQELLGIDHVKIEREDALVSVGGPDGKATAKENSLSGTSC